MTLQWNYNSLSETAGQHQAECRSSIKPKKALFVEYLMHSHKRSSLEFAPVMLWAIANALVDIAPIADELILLLSEDDVKELIEALWDAHGNVSKASQKLFLHRNTFAVSN